MIDLLYSPLLSAAAADAVTDATVLQMCGADWTCLQLIDITFTGGDIHVLVYLPRT